jgi:hypothetical protein
VQGIPGWYFEDWQPIQIVSLGSELEFHQLVDGEDMFNILGPLEDHVHV